MPDRYTKVVLTVIALSLVVLAVDSLSARLPTVQAQSTPPQKRCVWTQVREGGKPSLDENGEIKLGKEWQPVSEGGWELKATTYAIQAGASYIFERCESR